MLYLFDDEWIILLIVGFVCLIGGLKLLKVILLSRCHLKANLEFEYKPYPQLY